MIGCCFTNDESLNRNLQINKLWNFLSTVNKNGLIKKKCTLFHCIQKDTYLSSASLRLVILHENIESNIEIGETSWSFIYLPFEVFNHVSFHRVLSRILTLSFMSKGYSYKKFILFAFHFVFHFYFELRRIGLVTYTSPTTKNVTTKIERIALFILNMTCDRQTWLKQWF